MFGTTRPGVNAYMAVDMETGVFAASPHKLIVMLFDGAKLALSNALMHMNQGQTAAKGRSIAHAIRIINDGLRASLNKEVGGELALNLDALYDYMCNRLVLANLNNDTAILTEVIDLIDTIRLAWVQIDGSISMGSTPVNNPPVSRPRLDALTPRASSFIRA